LEIAQSLHDLADPLSSDKEISSLSDLISSLVFCVDFGKEHEKQLAFYVDCRRMFPNFDSVIQLIISRVLLLAMTCMQRTGGRKNASNSSFLKSCIAFVHITIPSIDSTIRQMWFYVNAAECALQLNLIGPGEDLLKAAVAVIPNLPSDSNSQQSLCSI
jgi:hypothetical protein